MTIILRIFSGLVIGLFYGALAGALAYLGWRLLNDPRYPGPMIPDKNAWGRIFVFFMTLVGSVLGVLVALVVSFTRLNNLRSALIGGVLGVLMFLLFFPHYPKGKMSLAFYRNEFLVGVALHFVVFPVGLTLVGLIASLVARKLPSN